MAALRDIARDFAPEIRDGIGWANQYPPTPTLRCR